MLISSRRCLVADNYLPLMRPTCSYWYILLWDKLKHVHHAANCSFVSPLNQSPTSYDNLWIYVRFVYIRWISLVIAGCRMWVWGIWFANSGAFPWRSYCCITRNEGMQLSANEMHSWNFSSIMFERSLYRTYIAVFFPQPLPLLVSKEQKKKIYCR